MISSVKSLKSLLFAKIDSLKWLPTCQKLKNCLKNTSRVERRGPNAKSTDEFGKVVDDYFTKANAKVDYSILSDEIKNIVNRLAKSKQSLEEIRSQSKDDLNHRRHSKKR